MKHCLKRQYEVKCNQNLNVPHNLYVGLAKDQESIQSSTTPGHRQHMGKWQNKKTNKHQKPESQEDKPKIICFTT